MRKTLLSLALICTASLGYAQILVDTTNQTNMGLGPTLSLSTIEYENEDGNTFGVERKTMGLGVIAGLISNVRLLFQGGYTFEAEFEDSKTEGDGYMFGGGLGFDLLRSKRVDLMGYTLLNYVKDTYEKPKYKKVEMSVTDLHLGLVTAIKANRTISLIGGIDLVPYSDGTLDFHHGEIDVEKEDMLNLKLGMSFNLPGITIKPEATLIGEKTFTLMTTFDI